MHACLHICELIDAFAMERLPFMQLVKLSAFIGACMHSFSETPFFRILVSCVPQFEKHRNDADIQWHVEHEMQEEMSRKSVAVSLVL